MVFEIVEAQFEIQRKNIDTWRSLPMIGNLENGARRSAAAEESNALPRFYPADGTQFGSYDIDILHEAAAIDKRRHTTKALPQSASVLDTARRLPSNWPASRAFSSLRRCAAAMDYGHSPMERCPPGAAKIGLTHLMATV